MVYLQPIMKDLPYNLDEPIVALATPWGKSALAVIRISGAGCIEKIAPLFSKPRQLLEIPGYTLLHGHILAPRQQGILDEVMLSVFRHPKSYTGEDSVEISCHGSLPGIQRILDNLRAAGFRDALPGEFTLRAFVHGKMDLTRAEAVREIVEAKSRDAQALALNRLGGSVEKRINGIKRELVNLMAAVEIQLDYPEEEIGEELQGADTFLERLEGLGGELRGILSTYRTGKIFQEGVPVVLAGSTNAGKSSLFNLFLREDRAIVSETHGTTRDYLESWITIGGIPIRLYDTAGFRFETSLVEREGIKRSELIIENAEVILYMVDSTQGVGPDDQKFLTRYAGQRLLKLWNKVDIKGLDCPQDFLPISAEHGSGFYELENALVSRILGHQADPAAILGGEVIIDSARQKSLLKRCLESLEYTIQGLRAHIPLDTLAVDLKDALNALGEITGEVTTADILNTMFSDFCVGK